MKIDFFVFKMVRDIIFVINNVRIIFVIYRENIIVVWLWGKNIFVNNVYIGKCVE